MNAEETVADALAKHADAGSRLVEIDPPAGPAEMDAYRFRVSCRCGWFALVPVDQTKRAEGERDFADVHAKHQAAVVAALPDIAVIELPKGENSHWEVMDWDGGRVSLFYDVNTVRCWLPNPSLETAEAEDLGIALIAASRHLAPRVAS